MIFFNIREGLFKTYVPLLLHITCNKCEICELLSTATLRVLGKDFLL